MEALSETTITATLTNHDHYEWDDAQGAWVCSCGTITSTTREESNHPAHLGSVMWVFFKENTKEEWAVKTPFYFSGPFTETVARDVATRSRSLYGEDCTTIVSHLATNWQTT